MKLNKPAVHFVAIGAALFALQHWGVNQPRAGGGEAPPATITITRARIRELSRDWIARTGRPPERRETEALVQTAIGEEILYREAVARGMGADDPVVRRRLVRNMRFLAGSDGKPAGTLYRDALALGMESTDLVVRRRLIQRLRLEIAAAARAAEPGDAELEAYLAQHREQFTSPARVRLAHVFLSRERRPKSLAADARALLAHLRAARVPPEQAARFSDPSPMPAGLPLESEQAFAKFFGPLFARRVMAVKAGSWNGPIPSSYGLHLVWVRAQVRGRLPPLETIRPRVRDAFLAQRAQAALEETLRRWRRRYIVRIEGPEPGTWAMTSSQEGSGQ